MDLLGDVGVEDRRYNEADDRSVAIPDRMESPPLGTVCTVADGDIRLASFKIASSSPPTKVSPSPSGLCGRTAARSYYKWL